MQTHFNFSLKLCQLVCLYFSFIKLNWLYIHRETWVSFHQIHRLTRDSPFIYVCYKLQVKIMWINKQSYTGLHFHQSICNINSITCFTMLFCDVIHNNFFFFPLFCDRNVINENNLGFSWPITITISMMCMWKNWPNLVKKIAF